MNRFRPLVQARELQAGESSLRVIGEQQPDE
jgi:hypothetical protein